MRRPAPRLLSVTILPILTARCRPSVSRVQNLSCGGFVLMNSGALQRSYRCLLAAVTPCAPTLYLFGGGIATRRLRRLLPVHAPSFPCLFQPAPETRLGLYHEDSALGSLVDRGVAV